VWHSFLAPDFSDQVVDLDELARTRASVERHVRALPLRALERCYDARVSADPSLRGGLRVMLVRERDGSGRATLEATSITDDALRRCVEEALPTLASRPPPYTPLSVDVGFCPAHQAACLVTPGQTSAGMHALFTAAEPAFAACVGQRIRGGAGGAQPIFLQMRGPAVVGTGSSNTERIGLDDRRADEILDCAASALRLFCLASGDGPARLTVRALVRGR
jgi:hypothetical protein